VLLRKEELPKKFFIFLKKTLKGKENKTREKQLPCSHEVKKHKYIFIAFGH
jgi:hypothetical protein